MGIVLKKLAKCEFVDNKLDYFEIEMNDGNVIHIQNDVIRLEMTNQQFYNFSVQMITAANKLIESKNL